jgi:hypothetical protein
MKSNLNEQVSKIKKIIYLNEDYELKHMYQPTGNSCGPTCIKMVGDFIKGDVGSIDDICKACGTDWVEGTPPYKMKAGLDKLKINYIEHIHEIEPYQSLKNVIDKGNIAIVRTLTKNVPHWIVVHRYDDNFFYVNDPWLGLLKYNESELESIWKIRDFFFYEIITGNQKIASDVTIRKMEENDFDYLKNILVDVFDKTGLSNEQIVNEISHFDMNISFVAMVNDEIAGFYFLGNDQIPEIRNNETYNKLSNLKGVEGIGLGVLKKFKNLGIGKKLIEYSQKIPNVDYIWGFQLKSLRNIDDWLKRRKIYFENDGLYITYQIFKNDK